MVDANKKIQQYYWIVGVITAVTIIVILTISFVITPTFKSIGQVNTELKEKKETLSVKEKKLTKLKELKVKEDELKEQSRIVYRAIPTKKEVGDIFIELNALETDAGGVFSGSKGGSSSASSASSTEGSTSDINTLSYSSDVAFPSYGAFKKLLSDSEQALRFVHLEHFAISSSEGSFKVSLSYKAYYRNQINTGAQ